jgi:hypothetical protein
MGNILTIGLTFVIAALVLLFVFLIPTIPYDQTVPTVFEIIQIRHTNQYGILNYESYMVVKNCKNFSYDNRKLYAKTYRNGELLHCIIPTINGHDFIPLHPHGIKTLGGPGTYNYHWQPNALVFIDYNQGTFHPGDVVVFEVYDRETGRIISRDLWPHTSGTTEKWLNLLFNPQAV